MICCEQSDVKVDINIFGAIRRECDKDRKKRNNG